MNIDERIAAIVQHDEQFIKGFFYNYRFLSNMDSPAPVFYNGIQYNSSENAYQAQKTLNEREREHIATLTPYQSKSYAQKFNNERPDWHTIKRAIMYDIVWLKFDTNMRLRLQLKATKDKYLEETNYWGDSFWGVCNGVGMNNLGNILMEVRAKL